MALITIAESIKETIAEKVAGQAHPGYSKDAQGEWFVVDGERIMHAERTRPWDPWHDDADVISVDDLVFIFGGAEQDNVDFDPTPDEDDASDTDETAWERAVCFAYDYVPDSYDTEVYEARFEV